jgi:hypothetical protein
VKFAVLTIALTLLAAGRLSAEESIALTKFGVACDLGALGTYTLGIPALDGRNTHAAPIPSSIETDGKELTAKFGPPFDGVTLRVKLLGDGQVQYSYDSLPEDARLVMCQFNIPSDAVVPGLTVTFDQMPPKEIPVEAGKTNDDVRLANANAKKLEIKWPTGEMLYLATPNTCWHGIQDSRVWGKSFVGVCLTPPLKRDTPGDNKSTFTMTFSVTPATTPQDTPASTSASPSHS